MTERDSLTQQYVHLILEIQILLYLSCRSDDGDLLL